MAKARIVHLSGPVATIQNTPPLVTSNKARAKYGLPLRPNPDGSAQRFDALRAQRLAAPATVYVEQFSAHPLESDAAELYGAPDGYLDTAGRFHKARQSAGDKPVYEIELKPEDGVYPLPYMARQQDGKAWEEECAFPGAPAEKARQGFFPDGSRSFEEIDRLSISVKGDGNLLSSKAEIDFVRVMPPAGFTKGRDGGAPEARGKDFFAYKPYHLPTFPSRRSLARATNVVQEILGSGQYDGAIWTEGSPSIEETIYWFHLLIDTKVPICGNAAQRVQGMISNDGPKNIVDSADFIASRVWADAEGRNRVGAVLIQEQRVFAARNVQKADARPGAYVATGGHGGILGAAGHEAPPLIHFVPTAKHTYLSEVNITRLPQQVMGVRRAGTAIEMVRVPIKDGSGRLLETAVPKVAIVKDGSYIADDHEIDPNRETDIQALIDRALATAPLAGLVIEGYTPYGIATSSAREKMFFRALHSGLPIVRVGRGNTEGFVPVRDLSIGGSNLTATKARILLMACLMRFGSPPPAADPDNPTPAERAATREKITAYQEVFNTH